MRIIAEEIDDEYYIDVLLAVADIEALLNGEFVQTAGILNKENLNVLVAIKENA